MVLQDLDGDDVVGAALPALDHLAECAAAEELEHLESAQNGSPKGVNKKKNPTIAIDAKMMTYLILGGQRIQHLVLDQLIVTVCAAARPLAGGLRVRMTPGRNDLCVGRLEAVLGRTTGRGVRRRLRRRAGYYSRRLHNDGRSHAGTAGDCLSR